MTARPEPHWVKFYVDGGTLMAARNTRRTRGVYWSMRCEVPETAPVFIRQQSLQWKTNNDAEWLALCEACLYAVRHHPDKPLVIYSDSMLVVKQINGEWRTKIQRHHTWRAICRRAIEQCKFVVIEWVPRKVNVEKLGH